MDVTSGSGSSKAAKCRKKEVNDFFGNAGACLLGPFVVDLTLPLVVELVELTTACLLGPFVTCQSMSL